jgi:formate/nitrite transporter FocA (FNT family)
LAWSAATGAIAGVDVGFGVFALLIVKEATGSELLGALAFIRFVALAIGNSELFTENFLVPVGSLLAGRSSGSKLIRLWGVTLVLNLVGGWPLTGLMMSGFPKLHHTAVELGRQYPDIGIGWRSFSGALLGGAIITLMTWLERSTPSIPAKLVTVISVAFVLAAAPLNHVVVVSMEMFAAMQVGAPFGYGAWLAVAAWYTLGNLIGGVVLVTGLRLVQVGRGRIAEERAATEEEALAAGSDQMDDGTNPDGRQNSGGDPRGGQLRARATGVVALVEVGRANDLPLYTRNGEDFQALDDLVEVILL